MAIERERSIPEVLQSIVADVQQIIRSEVLLAKTEIKEEASQAAKAGGLLAVGAAAGFYALGFLLLFCVYALEVVVVPWAAALIVGVAIAIAAALLIRTGTKRIKRIRPTPEKTIQSVKENVQWVKNQAK
jgi:hypothetical protein